jgi:hypothetical protein
MHRQGIFVGLTMIDYHYPHSVNQTFFVPKERLIVEYV